MHQVIRNIYPAEAPSGMRAAVGVCAHPATRGEDVVTTTMWTEQASEGRRVVGDVGALVGQATDRAPLSRLGGHGACVCVLCV